MERVDYNLIYNLTNNKPPLSFYKNNACGTNLLFLNYSLTAKWTKKATKLLRQYEVKARICYANAKKRSAKRARVNLYDHDRDQDFPCASRMYKAKRNTIEHIFKFVPKKICCRIKLL